MERRDPAKALASERKRIAAEGKQTAVDGPAETATDNDTEHQCPRCGFEAKTAGGLGSHMRSHSDDE